MTERRIPKVMFLCTANSCRSQMAEGFARSLGKGKIEPFSAGLFEFYVHPRALKVMKEAGVDISGQESEAINNALLHDMDIIITLCDHADEHCPVTPPEIQRLHWPVRDPVRTKGTEEEVMNDFRRARDEIRRKIEDFLRNM